MNALVVYDSNSGNTEKIALAIAKGVGSGTKAVRADAAEAQLHEVELLILGSPVLGGRPSPRMQSFMKAIPQAAAARLRVATFDTRMASKFAKLFGYAADRMATQAARQGCKPLLSPEGFIVTGGKGPLAEGELERATAWGKELSRTL